MIIETCPRCGADLVSSVLTCYPPIPKKDCPCCGWSWTGEPEKITRFPFGEDTCINYEYYDKYSDNSVSYYETTCDDFEED